MRLNCALRAATLFSSISSSSGWAHATVSSYSYSYCLNSDLVLVLVLVVRAWLERDERRLRWRMAQCRGGERLHSHSCSYVMHAAAPAPPRSQHTADDRTQMHSITRAYNHTIHKTIPLQTIPIPPCRKARAARLPAATCYTEYAQPGDLHARDATPESTAHKHKPSSSTPGANSAARQTRCCLVPIAEARRDAFRSQSPSLSHCPPTAR